MIRKLALSICILCSVSVFAQEKMYLHRSDQLTVGALISLTDSMYFNSTGSQVYFRLGSEIIQYSTSTIDSITFGENSSTIVVNYNGTMASVLNPLAFEGVDVVVNGADVVVYSTTETRDINYLLTGTATDGTFKIYSEKRFNLLLNGVDLTNPDGSAINIQADNKVSVALMDGTTNRLVDGTNYSTPPVNGEGEAEDQKAAFFSEGKLVFSGSGSLTISSTGSDQHALCSDDEIQIDGGIIAVTSAAKDGIHGKKGVSVSDGTVSVTSSGDGIDGDEGFILVSGGNTTVNCGSDDISGFNCDSTLVVSGGKVDIILSGNQSKGMKSNQPITLSGGDITIKTTGGVVLEASGSGYNPAYCTGIKGDSTSVTLSGANVTMTSSGIAGKGISADGDITITGGTVNVTTTGGGATYKNSTGTTDAYNATCILADGNINIIAGLVTTSSSGSGGKGISAEGALTFGDNNNSPVVNITTTGTKITISGSTSTGGGPGWGGGPGGGTNEDNGVFNEAKAIKAEGAIVFNKGTINIASADDGIKSPTSITFNGGKVLISNSIEGVESFNITINGGEINVSASDDCINSTKGGSTMSGSDGSNLTITGGNTVVNSTIGDAIDSNGNIIMTGGSVIDHGPTSSPEEGVDFNGTFTMTGGFFVASGSNSNMNQAMSSSSTQNNIYVLSKNLISSGTLFNIQDANGNSILTFKPVRSYYSILFSSSDLKNGSTYSIFTGGTSTGTISNGLYSGGTYSGGTQKKSFTVSGKVTSVSF